jgi:hypothetical protein
MICTLCLTGTAQIFLLILEVAVAVIHLYIFVILRTLYFREVSKRQYTKITLRTLYSREVN